MVVGCCAGVVGFFKNSRFRSADFEGVYGKQVIFHVQRALVAVVVARIAVIVKGLLVVSGW